MELNIKRKGILGRQQHKDKFGIKEEKEGQNWKEHIKEGSINEIAGRRIDMESNIKKGQNWKNVGKFIYIGTY